jgi:ABC-2 type transport system ATP-binding protein
MTSVLATERLSKRYGSTFALRDCTLQLPPGRVAALVGPNGAGKTTLLHLAVGLLRPTEGTIRVLGGEPWESPREVLPRVGFVAQEHPLYRDFTVEETLAMGRALNPTWNGELALGRLRRLRIPLHRRVGRLSGGQRAQVALALALGKRPELMLLDEPLASLDPLARREFLSSLMEAVSETGMTVLLSSHDISDLERVCDHLVIVDSARVRLEGSIGKILHSHRRLVGPTRDHERIANVEAVVHASRTERQTSLLARVGGPILDPAWDVREVTLEDVVLGYLGASASGSDEWPEPSLEVAQ